MSVGASKGSTSAAFVYDVMEYARYRNSMRCCLETTRYSRGLPRELARKRDAVLWQLEARVLRDCFCRRFRCVYVSGDHVF